MRSRSVGHWVAGLVVAGLTAAAVGYQPVGVAKADETEFVSWTHAVAWGYNQTGQLGVGSTQDRPTPVAVASPHLRFHRLAGGSAHSLAMDNQGNLYGWGANDSFQIGGSDVAGSLVPRSVPGLSGVTRIAAGDRHSVAR